MEQNNPNLKSTWGTVIFMWSLLLLGYILNFFHSFTTGILQPHLMKDFSLDAGEVTAIGSMFFYCYLLMQIPTGILLDKFGVRLVAASGSFLAALGAILFGSATEAWVLYVARSCIGMGTSVMFISIIKFQLAWFKPSIMTTITGITCFVGTLGGIGAQSPLAFLVETFGWRNSLYAIALLSFMNGLSIALFVKNSPSAITGEANGEKQTETPSILKGFLLIISSGRTWGPGLLYAAFYGSYVLIVGYVGTSWLENVYGMTTVTASSYMIPCVLGSALGPIGIGILADRTGLKKLPMLGAGFIYLFIWIIMAWGGNNLPLYLLPIILFGIGFFSRAFVVCWSCVQAINPKEFSGIATSVVNMSGFIGPIALPFLFVKIQGTFANPASPESYEAAFLGVLGVVFFGVLCGFLAKEPRACKPGHRPGPT